MQLLITKTFSPPGSKDVSGVPSGKLIERGMEVFAFSPKLFCNSKFRFNLEITSTISFFDGFTFWTSILNPITSVPAAVLPFWGMISPTDIAKGKLCFILQTILPLRTALHFCSIFSVTAAAAFPAKTSRAATISSILNSCMGVNRPAGRSLHKFSILNSSANSVPMMPPSGASAEISIAPLFQ